MAVAEQAGHGLAIHFLADILRVGGIAIVAGGILMLAAMVATAAGDREGHDDALTLFERRSRTGFDHFAHKFMAKDIARLHGGDIAVIEMQVRPADGRRRDFDDRVARV